MQHVTDQNYGTIVDAAALPVVLDFGAAWCGPCKRLEPILEEISGAYADRVLFATVDIDHAPDTARKFGVMSVPTVVFMKGGQVVHKFVGLEQKGKIEGMILKHLGV